MHHVQNFFFEKAVVEHKISESDSGDHIGYCNYEGIDAEYQKMVQCTLPQKITKPGW